MFTAPRSTRFIFLPLLLLLLAYSTALAADPFARLAAAPAAPDAAEAKGIEPDCLAFPARVTGGPDGYGYGFKDQDSPGGPVPGFVDISASGTAVTFVNSGGTTVYDDGAAQVDLTIPFTFYGTAFTSLKMTTNGYISTDLADIGFDFSNDCPLPHNPSSGGGARIYPYHDDWVVDGGGYHQYFDPCPVAALSGAAEDCTVFMWSDLHQFGQSGQAVDFEAVLFHDSGEIRYQYRDLGDVTGSSQTVGIQDFPPVTTGLAYGCNTAGMVGDATAVSFVLVDPADVGDLALAKTAGIDALVVGETVDFTLGVTNNGPRDQTGVAVYDSLPFGLSYVDDSCGGTFADGLFTWNVGNLASGRTRNCQLTAMATRCGLSVTNSAETEGGGRWFDPAANSTSSDNVLISALGEVVLDGSFEGGSPSAVWTEASTNFGTPLCTAVLCGTGGGTCVPRTGTWWAWFGGTSVYEQGSVVQDVLIPATGEAYLSFWMFNGAHGGPGVDYVKALVDGNEVWRVYDNDPRYTAGYRRVIVDVSAYADGGWHGLAFISEVFGTGTTNFAVDDIAINECSEFIFSDDFSDGGRAGDIHWNEVRGAWSVSAAKTFVSGATGNNIAVSRIFDPWGGPLATGRLEATVKLTRAYARYANGAIIFAYQDPGHYRFVRLRKGKIQIGQKGAFGGETAVIRTVAANVNIGTTYKVTVDIYPGGWVQVYLDDVAVDGHMFRSVPLGGAGFWALKARTLFDDFAAWDEYVLP